MPTSVGEFEVNGMAFSDYWTAQDEALRQAATTGATVAIGRPDGDGPTAVVTPTTVRLLRASRRLLALVVACEPLVAMPRIEADGAVEITWWVGGDLLDFGLEVGGTWKLETQSSRQYSFIGAGSVDEPLPDHVLLAIRDWLHAHLAKASLGAPNHLRRMWAAVGDEAQAAEFAGRE